ncbi:MAG: hypothetical protein ACPHIA_07805, partial [Alphaproteobacteria bacterium]
MDCLTELLDLRRAKYTARTHDGIGKALVFTDDDGGITQDIEAAHKVLIRIERKGGALYRWFDRAS